MGAFGGSMSFSTFLVRGDPPEGDIREPFLQGIRRNTFRPLVPEEEATDRGGWCSISGPLDLDLEHDKVFYGSYLNLGLRLDKWRIPAPVLKAHVGEAELRVLDERGKERLSKHEKEDVKAMVVAALRRQMMPAMKVIDMVWNLDTGVVRLWNQSTTIHELFEDLFKKSFDLELVPMNPYVAAGTLGLDDRIMDNIEELAHAQFHVTILEEA